MSDYIYMRVSDKKQNHGSQLVSLMNLYPDAKIIEETMSGVKTRPMLDALVGSMVAGDRLIIYSLDRLGRRAHLVLALLEDLAARGITLISKREGVDYTTIAGKLVTQIMASMAEMERELISERTKAGLAAAKAKGRSLGTPTTISQDILDRAVSLVEDEGVTIPKAARQCEYVVTSGKHKGETRTLSISYLRKLLNKKRAS